MRQFEFKGNITNAESGEVLDNIKIVIEAFTRDEAGEYADEEFEYRCLEYVCETEYEYELIDVH